MSRPPARPGPILEEAGFLRAFRVQCDVVGALIMRDIQSRFGRENLGWIWLFLEPMILAGAIATLHELKGHGLPGGLMPFPFWIISYTPHYLFRGMVTRAPLTIEANRVLFYHARIRLHDVLLARTIVETGAVCMALVVFLGGVGIVTGVWPHDPLRMAGALVMMALFAHALALLFLAATVVGAHAVDRIVHPFTYLSMPLTGAFFMVWWMPPSVQEMMVWIPPVHVYEMIREAYFGPVVPFFTDVAYLATSTFALLVAGMWALRVAEPHLEE